MYFLGSFLVLFFFLSSTLADDYGDSISTAAQISVNQAVQGRIDCGGDRDFFKVKLVQGRNYRLTLQALDPTSPSFDVFMTFYGPTGSKIDENDDISGSNKNSRIEYQAASTDTYYIEARGFNSGKCGKYVFAAIDYSPECSTACENCQPISSPSPCTICGSGVNCPSCSNSPTSTVIGGYCPCDVGRYYDSGSCPPCSNLDGDCLDCRDSSTCTDCTDPLLIYGSSCETECPGEAYNNGAGYCIPCTSLHGSCLTCNSSLTCTSCDHGLVALGKNCVTDCISGTYENSGICTSCKTLDPYCLTCNASDTCTGCSSSKYALGQTCEVECPGGTFNDNGVCTSCKVLDNFCETCNGSSSCLSCSSSLFALGVGCATECPGDTYDASGLCTSCKTLDDYCLTCNASTTCTSCGNSKYALGHSCVNGCPTPETFELGGICTSCKTLDDSCEHCNGTTHCTHCSMGLFALGTTCISECPSGTFDDNGVCTSCKVLDSFCETCNSSSSCLSCSNSLFALGAGCATECPGDTYDASGLCTSCKTLDDYCLTCNASTTCTSCDNSKYALGHSCVNGCPTPETFELGGICTSCKTLDDSCEHCNGTTHCTHCSGGQFALGTACVPECPDGTFDDNGICTSCVILDVYCTKCNSTDVCLSCSDGLVALGSFCTESCPLGTYDNSGLCTSCKTLDDYCLECVNNKFCPLCDNNMLILGPNCVTSCPSGTKNNEGICTNTAYKITLAYTSSTSSYLVQFPSALVYDIADIPSISTVTLQNIAQSAYNYTLTKKSQNVYQIDFQYTNSIPSTTLKFRYTLNATPTTSNLLTGRWIATISTRYMSFISDSDKELLNGIGSAVSGAITAATAGAGSVAILGGNPALLWPLLSLFQTFYYLIFIDVNYPANVQMFLKLFSLGSLSFIPNPLDWFVKDIDEYDLPVPGRYNEYEFSGLFLDNAGNELLLLCGVIAMYVISKFAMKWLRKLPTSARMITNKTVGWFEWSGLLKSVVASYTDMVQAVFLQLRVLTYGLKVFGLSSVLAFVALGFSAAFPILTFWIIRKYDDHPELLTIKYEGLVEEYDLNKKAGRYFVPIWLVRRLVMCASLVFLQGYAYVQINILCINIVVSIIHLWVYCPFETKRENICNTITEILFGAIHVAIYILIYDDHNPSFTEEQRLQMGWVIIVACGVILIISVVFLNIVEQVKDVIKGIKLAKKLMSKPDKTKTIKEKVKKEIEIVAPEQQSQLNLDQSRSFEFSRTNLDVASVMTTPELVPKQSHSLRRNTRFKRVNRDKIVKRIQELRQMNS